MRGWGEFPPGDIVPARRNRKENGEESADRTKYLIEFSLNGGPMWIGGEKRKLEARAGGTCQSEDSLTFLALADSPRGLTTTADFIVTC